MSAALDYFQPVFFGRIDKFADVLWGGGRGITD
jgi:hypothetical protein